MKEKQILQQKLETTLKNRARDIGQAIEHIQKQGTMIDDYVTPVKDIIFDTVDKKVVTHVDGVRFGLHNNAVAGFVEKDRHWL
jgi:hypothetical protein